MQAIFKRFFHIQGMIFILSLMALACLPIALSDLVRDAGLSLLLPITLFGVIFAWLLVGLGVRKSLTGLALLFLGPLAISLRIGQMGGALFELIRQLFVFIPSVFNTLVYKTPLDFPPLLLSMDELAQKIFVFSGRLSFWVTSFLQGIKIEDPVVRTLAWSMVLWFIAIWAGWQIYANNKYMLGMLPSTLLLAFVLNNTSGERLILWFHLTLLLFLFGLTNYHKLQSHWDASHTDYAESTGVDTMLLVTVIAVGLVAASYSASTFSVKEIIDKFREERVASNVTSAAPSSGVETLKSNFRVTGLQNGMPRSYLLSSGPEISHQLAMTISTGELPPLPPSANPTVPRYYWRTLTYSIYTGAGWANPAVLAEDISADQALIETTDPRYRVLDTQVTFSDQADERLYWTGTLASVDVPFTAAWNRRGKGLLDSDMLAALAAVDSYKTESVLLNVSMQDLRDSPSVYPDWVRKRFLTLPDSVPERVLALARDLTASEPTAYDRALAIQNHLREYPYTLNISAPPSGRDVTDYFLFDLKQGYCDYYATSMVVLARAAGLPARLVVGYANGSYDLTRAQYIVTEDYAHSWVEIYFANIGWVEFEPTASQPAIDYEVEEHEIPTPTLEAPPSGQPLVEKFASFILRAFRHVWLPILLISICGFLWLGYDSLRLTQIEPSQTIQLLYKRLRRLARPITGIPAKDQTALSFSLALIERLSTIEAPAHLQNWIAPSRNEIIQLTEIFSDSLFTPHPPTRTEAKAAIQTWSRLRWRMLLANLLRNKNK